MHFVDLKDRIKSELSFLGFICGLVILGAVIFYENTKKA